MTARLRELWTNVVALLLALPPARRAVVLATGAGSLVLVLVLAWWVQQPLYRPLFANLGQEDAAAIVAALQTDKVPYQLDDGGRAVLVPAERLYELRLALASRGLPEGGGVGFEIFDKQLLGQTDFVQHLNYQRALQGELGRTIAELGGVESARVHLAIPERSLFVSQERQPTASVVVKLARGRSLTGAQIDGIVHLVASSVQGMAPDGVTVVDEGGRRLTAERRGEDGLAADGGAVAYQRAIERAAEERIESLLATVVGTGKVIARVAATVDLARTERTEEVYDPDKTVLRQNHATREETTGAKLAAVAPGTTATLTSRTTTDASDQRTERRDETQSFEVSKTTSRTVAPMGAVKALSVAVLIDGTYRDENGTRVFVPRTDEELGRLKTLVASAVGVSEARGDRLEVTSAPFQTPAVEAGADGLARTPEWLPSILLRLLGVGVVLAVLALVVRPLAQTLGTSGRRTEPLPGAAFLDRDAPVGELARENVALAQQHPERAAQLVRQWLLESTKTVA